jgi:hypothetical protein
MDTIHGVREQVQRVITLIRDLLELKNDPWVPAFRLQRARSEVYKGLRNLLSAEEKLRTAGASLTWPMNIRALMDDAESLLNLPNPFAEKAIEDFPDIFEEYITPVVTDETGETAREPAVPVVL